MKKNKLKKFILVLLFFLCAFLAKYESKETFGVYSEALNTTVYLSVVNPSATYTINYNAGSGSIVQGNSQYTKTLNSELGPLPKAEKTGSNFIGWYTSGGTRVNAKTIVTADATYYAHYTDIICTRASSLHSSGNTNFGSIPNSSTLASGFAYDCDVDNNLATANERFYYLTSDSTKKYEVFIYSDNVSNGVAACDGGGDGVLYGASINYNGPTNAYNQLPSWGNVSLHGATRQIRNELGGTTAGNNNLAQFTYTNKTTRFATTQEIEAACGITVSTSNGATTQLNNCRFLLENTSI